MKDCKHCWGTGKHPDWKKLGRELRRRRAEAGISLRKAACKAGMSSANLSDMERGHRSMGGTKSIKVLRMFQLSPEAAFEEGPLHPNDEWA